MPLRPDALDDRRFWVGIHVPALGMISSDEPDMAAYCSALRVTEADAHAWFEQFTGPFIRGSDGASDDPAVVDLRLAAGVQLRVEIHPGGQYWQFRDRNGVSVELANVGPHWQLPGLRWAEAEEIARAAPARKAEVLLLMLPTIWLTDDEDHAAVQRAVARAWMASGLVGVDSATKLAEIWASAVAGGREYPWQQTAAGEWISSAEWSSRSSRRHAQEPAAINRLIAAAREE